MLITPHPADATRTEPTIMRTLIVSALLVPFGIMLIGAWLAWEQTRNNAEAELRRTADAGAEYVARVLDSQILLADRVDDLLRGLSDQQIQDNEWSIHVELQRMLGSRPAILTLYAISGDAHPLVSANLYPVPRSADLSDRDYFMTLRDPAGPSIFVSKTHVGRFDGQTFFSVAQRRGEGTNALAWSDENARFRGVVLASLRPNELGIGLRRLVGESSDTITLLRTEGDILAQSNGVDPEPAMTAAVVTGRTGIPDDAAAIVVRSLVETDGIARMEAFRRVTDWPVYVSAARPQGEIVAQWCEIVAWQAGFGGPAALALVGLVVQAFRRSRQMEEARAALRIEASLRMTAEAMRESAIRLRVATEGAGLGLYEFDFTRGVVWFDTRAIEAYHYLQPSGAWLPIDGPECVAVLARFHPDDRIRLDTALANFADGSADNVALECRVRGRDGNWHWIWTQGTALERHRTTGRPLRLVGIIQDVTARRRLEAQITRA